MDDTAGQDETATVGVVAPGVVAWDLPCVSCGYNLRGLAESGTCPECGAAVERSRLGTLLRFSSPAYVATLWRGAVLVKWAVPAVIAVYVGSYITFLAGNFGRWAGAAWSLAGAGCWLAFWAGWWLLGTPDPAASGRREKGGLRRLSRAGAGACGVSTVTSFALSEADSLPRPWAALLMGLFAVAWAFAYFAGLSYLRELGGRLGDSATARRANRLIWVGVYFMTAVVLVIWLSYWLYLAVLGLALLLCAGYMALAWGLAARLREVREWQRLEAAARGEGYELARPHSGQAGSPARS